MNKIRKKIRLFLRGFYRTTNGFIGFSYDFYRYLFFSGWRENLNNAEVRNYNIMMAYHGLEKSLSYKERNPTSGWGNAERVFLRLKIANANKNVGFHDKGAKRVLTQFLQLPENINQERSKKMLSVLEKMKFDSDLPHGSLEINEQTYERGKLKDPEAFFTTRHSLREFQDVIVDDDLIYKAVNLAMRTPSVCNRQAWHVYYSNERKIIDKALSYQNGNRPFGKKIPNLMIITTDLKAFFAGAEHYQHWIDGGLFSMSIMYAFHSLGVATCPLNWSQTPKRDKQLRNALKIQPNHTVIMMMAIGHPDVSNKVCGSTRRPVDEIFSKLELR